MPIKEGEVRVSQCEQYQYHSGVMFLATGDKLAYYNLGDGKPTLVKVRPDIDDSDYVFAMRVKVVAD